MGEDPSDPNFILDAIEDPRLKPRTGATVIRLRAGRLDINTCPEILIERGHMYKPDATKLCSQGPGVLLDNIDQKVATELTAALAEVEEPCFVVPAAEILRLPPVAALPTLRMTKTELQASDVKGKVHCCPWPQAVVLSLAHVELESTETRVVRRSILNARIAGAGGIGGVVGAATMHGSERKTETKSTSHSLLDLVFRDPWRRYRINPQHFDFSLLGDQLQPASEANLLNLARWLLYAAPQSQTNVDRERLAATSQVDLPRLSERQFEDLSYWLLNLAHFGKEPLSAKPR